MSDFPAHGRIAGIDYGEARIGIAVTDAERTVASPWEVHARGDEAHDSAYFQRLVNEERIVGFVIGLPIRGGGEESEMSRAARRFGQWLSETTGSPIRFYDERYSSSAADEIMAEAGMPKKERKKRRDMIAAQVVLASFLESDGEAEHHGAIDGQ